MAYPPFPDRKLPWDINGTVVGFNQYTNGFGSGITGFLTSDQMTELNDTDNTVIWNDMNAAWCFWFFFPELTIVDALFVWEGHAHNSYMQYVQASNDSGNGTDGTWVDATIPTGLQSVQKYWASSADWRTSVTPISFAQSIRCLRIQHWGDTSLIGKDPSQVVAIHIFGHKDTGQTPDDIIFLDSAGTGLEWSPDPDWGDVPYLANNVKQFKIKNTSSTKTANTIALTCNDADFTISDNGSSYGTSISLASLAPGASSPTWYIKANPSALTLPGARETRIVSTVGSWT